MRQTFSWDDSRWQLGSVEQRPFGQANDLDAVQEWIPASVPGNVHADLLRAGKIPDPFYAMNNETVQWVDGLDWWYTREVELGPAEPDTRRFIIFEGIDYQSATFWNGMEQGRHIGMFSRQIHEIPPALWAPRSRLAVRVWGPDALPDFKLTRLERLAQRTSNLFFPYNTAFADRLATLKHQMSFGWDFAPRLRSCGIWDEASLVETRAVLIRDAWARGLPDGRVMLDLTLDADHRRPARLRLTLRGKNFESGPQEFEFPVTLDVGPRDYHLQFQLRDPHAWNPWDRGEPNLYTLECEVMDDSGTLDSCAATLGLRTIELEPNPGAPAEEAPWTFVVNGVPEFIRGANWVPADALPGRVTRADYDALLRLAREAHINLLRVWGGGLREKRPFYDLCDELGILVWQEFPFSGAPLDHARRDGEFLGFVRAECGAIVRDVRGHPALALWCGGNEHNTFANAPLVQTLREVVALNDGTRAFKPGSPSVGEHHNWRVWHWQANTRDYRDDEAGFMGEFGLQSPPSASALAGFIPPAQLWPPGDAWLYHKAELTKLWRYARAVDPRIDSLEAFVHASQTAQLRGLQVMIEHARRNRGRTGGCAFWQFNEPWPAISWSVVDYFRAAKPAYAKLRQLYNPVLVSFYYPLEPRQPGGQVAGELWLVNDTLSPVRGELRAILNGETRSTLEVQAEPNSVTRVGALQLELGVGANYLQLELAAGDSVLSINEYDLNYCDRGEISPGISPLQRLAARLQS